jgi:endonuclease/exonuclease/phosphatase family metal-dependent hydrolase
MTVQTLRVATWNVHGLRAGVEAAARLVRGERVDILMLQESGPRSRLRALGAILGMVVCSDPPAFPRRRIQNAVLVRPPRRVRSDRLVRFDGGSLIHPRGALITRLDDVTVLSVHLGLESAERARHVPQLLEIVGNVEQPVVIAGDLNARPEDASPARIAASYPDVWASVGERDGQTFPSHAPTARIDFLFAGQRVQPLRAWTAGGTVSDHLMVVADLRMDDGA